MLYREQGNRKAIETMGLLPPNEGKRFQIRVNGIKRNGYFSRSLKSVGIYDRGAWIFVRAQSLAEGRDRVRQYYEHRDRERLSQPDTLPAKGYLSLVTPELRSDGEWPK